MIFRAFAVCLLDLQFDFARLGGADKVFGFVEWIGEYAILLANETNFVLFNRFTAVAFLR